MDSMGNKVCESKALAQWEEFSLKSTHIQRFIRTLCQDRILMDPDDSFFGDPAVLYFVKMLRPSGHAYSAFPLPVHSRALESHAPQVKWLEDLK